MRIPMAKNYFRKEIITNLRNLSESYKKDASDIIQQKVIDSNLFQNSKSIGIYINFGNEVKTNK